MGWFSSKHACALPKRSNEAASHLGVKAIGGNRDYDDAIGELLRQNATLRLAVSPPERTRV